MTNRIQHKTKGGCLHGCRWPPFLCSIRLRKRTNLSVLVTSEPDELSIPGQLARSKSAERCGSPAATSKGHWPFEAPTEPTGETSSLQGSRVKSLPSDMMLCVISYWVLSGAKRRQIQQFCCFVLSRKMLKRRLEKSFIVRLFTYNK